MGGFPQRKELQTLRELVKCGPDSYLPTGGNANSVHRIRKNLGKDSIHTANMVGYRLTEEGRKKAKEILERETKDG